MFQSKSGVYIIKIDKYNYVGQSVNISNRMKNHKYTLKKGIHRNRYLQNVYNKYKYYEVKVQYVEKEYLTIIEQCWINILSNTVNLLPAENSSLKRRPEYLKQRQREKTLSNKKCIDALVHETGDKHWKYNHTKYKYYNLFSGEIIEDTQFNFAKILVKKGTTINSANHTASRIAKEKQKVSNGWCLYKNKDVKVPNYKCKLK